MDDFVDSDNDTDGLVIDTGDSPKIAEPRATPESDVVQPKAEPTTSLDMLAVVQEKYQEKLKLKDQQKGKIILQYTTIRRVV